FRSADVRHGECVAHTDTGDIPVKFTVEWQDRNLGRWQIRIPPADLPLCSDPAVTKLLEQAIRSQPVGPTLSSIDGHHEIRYDSEADVRYGECVAHTDSGDIPVKFTLGWQDRKAGQIQIQILPADLPLCSDPAVITLLEQIIRNLSIGPTLKSIDGHREVRYDSEADVRHGECVAHTDTGDIPVKFTVEWQDRNQGQFQIRLSPAGPL
ncbi:MAG: hypothetical protein VB858_14210, partial [Planctomycetaceae bacterium]